jgi:hypothetical protein
MMPNDAKSSANENEATIAHAQQSPSSEATGPYIDHTSTTE